VNHEFEKLRKETFGSNLRYYPEVRFEGLRTTKTSVRTDGLLAEV
jgi:hypothetical protein